MVRRVVVPATGTVLSILAGQRILHITDGTAVKKRLPDAGQPFCVYADCLPDLLEIVHTFAFFLVLLHYFAEMFVLW